MQVYIRYKKDGYVEGWSVTPYSEDSFAMEYDESSHFFENFLFYKIENQQAVYDEEAHTAYLKRKEIRAQVPELEEELKRLKLLIDRHRDEKELEQETTLKEEEYKELLKKRNEVVTLLEKGSEL